LEVPRADDLLHIGWIIAMSDAIMYPLFSIIDYLGWFRSESLEEFVRLDISYHACKTTEGVPVGRENQKVN